MTQIAWLCRRCATVFSAPSLTTLDPAPELQRRLAQPAKTERLTVHDCGHGGFGVADLVGAVPEVGA
jgi:hypothetical protein